MGRITQKQIIDTLKTGWNGYADPSDFNLVVRMYHTNNNSLSYSSKFKADYPEWTAKNWREVAKDVQELIFHYKSR